MRALYQHVYTLHEMLEVFTRLCAREGSGRDGTERGELEMDLRGYPTWRRVRAPLSDLVAFECVPKKTARYADRRRAGARFPPIIAVPVDAASRSPAACQRMGIPYARWDIVEGNHRTCAARRAGDRAIDAFVPCDADGALL